MSIYTPEPKLRRLTAGVVAAYIARTPVPAAEQSGVIRLVFAALDTVEPTAPPSGVRPEPAVPVKKSVLPDHIVCLEDGRRMKMLKGYLRTKYGMTPGEYRARWGLPDSYPMTAPGYSAQRSDLARKGLLGRKPLQPMTAEVAVRQTREGAKGRRPGRKVPAPE